MIYTIQIINKNMSEFNSINNNNLSEDELIINQLLNDDINNMNDSVFEQIQSTHLTQSAESKELNNTDLINSEANKLTEFVNDILEDESKNNQRNQLHESMYEMAMNTIPEMLIPINMIILNGELNELPVKILLDTGASSSVIFNHAIKRLSLSELIDTESSAELRGIGTEKSLGQIWYTELKLNGNIYPISLIASTTQIKEFDMILGINFLQSYGAVLNFKTRTLTLNDKYEIKFNL